MSREEKKLLIEQLLDEFIEQHNKCAEKASCLCEEISLTAKVWGMDNYVLMDGVVKLGELLGCCIKFVPESFSTKAIIEYKGFLFVENIY